MGHGARGLQRDTAPPGTISRTTMPAAAPIAGARTGSPASATTSQRLCLGLALWNGRDPILKERLFGLTNGEGNHGEDVKELYYYLDAHADAFLYARCSTSTRRRAFPYGPLVEENRRRGRAEPEFELIDTGVFDDDRYFDVFVEYAKAAPDDILMRVTVAQSRAGDGRAACLAAALVPQYLVVAARIAASPQLAGRGDSSIVGRSSALSADAAVLPTAAGAAVLRKRNQCAAALRACDAGGYFKDGINDYIVNGDQRAVNPERSGTKAAAHIGSTSLPAGDEPRCGCASTADGAAAPFDDFDGIFARAPGRGRRVLCRAAAAASPIADARLVQRQALAGMLWTQAVLLLRHPRMAERRSRRSRRRPRRAARPQRRMAAPQQRRRHLDAGQMGISLVRRLGSGLPLRPLALIDPEFAKGQLVLLTREWYMHPNGQLPAYEWAFGDVNPPVHAWAAWRVYRDRPQAARRTAATSLSSNASSTS